jgi:hypothetical protein
MTVDELSTRQRGANHGPSGPNTRADTAVSHHDSDDIAFWTSDRDEIDQEESPQ